MKKAKKIFSKKKASQIQKPTYLVDMPDFVHRRLLLRIDAERSKKMEQAQESTFMSI